MLRTLRGGLNSFFVIFLLGLLIASFAIWGIGDIFRGNTSVVAQVGSTEITASEFLRTFQNRVQTYQAQFGTGFDTQQAIAFGLHRQVLDEMIRTTTLDEEARDMGLLGSTAAVVELIQDMDAFKDPLGEFSRFNYDNRLAGVGLTSQAYENSLRLELARMQLIDGIMASTPVPPSLVETLYSFRKERRQAEILSLTASSLSVGSEPDEATLLAFHDQNTAMFTQPEYRDLSILELNPAALAEEMEITEDQIREAYELAVDQYQTPETRSIQVLVVDDQETAQAIFERVSAGEAFGAVAFDVSGFSEDDISLGDLDYFTVETDYNDIAAERIFALNTGEITVPTQTLFGWHVFAVTAIQPATARSLDEVRNELVTQISSNRGLDRVYDLVATIEDELAAGADMEGLQDITQLPVLRIPAVSYQGLAPSGVPAPGALERLDLIHEGFGKLADDELDLLETPDGGYYLVQVNAIIAPAVKPYEDVRAEVRAGWVQQELTRLAAEQAQEALESAEAGISLDELAQRYGGVTVTTDLLPRDAAQTSGQVSPAVARLMFSLNQGGVDMERAATGDGYLIVMVTNIVPGIADTSSEEFMALTARIASEIQNDLLVQYQIAVQASLGIEVNNTLIDQMLTPDGIVMPGVQQVR
jgi:peptidyl-prolyl cis-trans isomerase D